MYKKLTLMALVATTALAADWCDCGEWAVGAEALYWKPAHCDINWGFIERNVDDMSDRTDLVWQADYDWGVRVFGTYSQDCFELGLSYLWLETHDSRRVDTDDTLEIIGDREIENGLANSQLRFRYQNVDLRATRLLHSACDCHFGVTANVRWVDIDFSLQARGEEDFSDDGYTQRNSFEGAALGVGLIGRFGFCGCFDLGGRLGIMGTIAERKLREARVDEGSPIDFDRRLPSSHTAVSPAAEFQLGLGWETSCGCADLRFEIGYELDYYFDSLYYPVDVQDTEGADLPQLSCQGIGFGGLYFGLSVGF